MYAWVGCSEHFSIDAIRSGTLWDALMQALASTAQPA